MSKTPPIVDTKWLSEQLDTKNPKVVVLDSSWISADHHGNHNKYLEKHIPGSLFLDHNRCITPRPTCARMLPDLDRFTDYARSLGIDTDSHIILYDRENIHSSTKAWWLFRVFDHHNVSVLDGGFMKWEADGYPVSSGEGSSKKMGNFQINLDRSLIAEYDDMIDIVKNKSCQIVDTRKIEHFSGTEQEPCHVTREGLDSMGMPIPTNMHSGHIPGAIQIYRAWVLDPGTWCFLSKEKLLKLFSEKGIYLNKPLTTTCYLGHSASIINMAAFICGKEDAPLYYGSWTEYGQIAPKDMVETSKFLKSDRSHNICPLIIV